VNRLELRAWRDARGLTLNDLSELLGVDRQTIHRWESGRSTVPPFLNLALDQLDSLHALPRRELENVS
jgi:transcriptional regulator with XRE-family HTH domain